MTDRVGSDDDSEGRNAGRSSKLHDGRKSVESEMLATKTGWLG